MPEEEIECPSCGTLVDAGEERCPICGTSIHPKLAEPGAAEEPAAEEEPTELEEPLEEGEFTLEAEEPLEADKAGPLGPLYPLSSCSLFFISCSYGHNRRRASSTAK